MVPKTMVHSILKTHHDDMAHCGTRKTYEGLAQHYWFPHMRKCVQEYNCVTCITANSSPNRLESETCLTPSPKAPMEVVHVDHFGLLQQTENNYKYILVMIDAFTRFVWLFATRTTGTRETTRNLRTVFDTFGNPSEIVSDRGTAFTSVEFSNFIHLIRAKHRKVAVAAPWANGMVERVNRFLKNSLIKILDSSIDWESCLGHLQYVLNNTHHAVIKTSPSKLLLGYHQRNHGDFDLSQLTKALTDAESELSIENLRDKARQTTDSIKNYNKGYKNARYKTPSMYNEGDFVLIRDSRVKPGENAKLKLRYKGPYLIKKVLGNNRYVVTDIYPVLTLGPARWTQSCPPIGLSRGSNR